MRPRAWLLLSLAAAGIVLAILADASGARPLLMLGGVCILAAAVLGVTYLPFWSRLPRLEPMPGLFARGPGTWCATCGRMGPVPCRTCGGSPKARAGAKPARPGKGRPKAAAVEAAESSPVAFAKVPAARRKAREP